MKTQIKNNFYSNNDEINFEKLNNFKKFNSNIKKEVQIENLKVKYSNSDKNNFDNILKKDKKSHQLKEIISEKEIKYYNTSDFLKFEKLDNFAEYNRANLQNIQNIKSQLNYSVNDYNEFDKIIQTKIQKKKLTINQNNKIKIIDYDKLRNDERKIKDKSNVGKIKIVYFD